MGSWIAPVVPEDFGWKVEAHRFVPDVEGPRDPIATGLLDQFGRELFRLPEPIGFHHPMEVS